MISHLGEVQVQPSKRLHAWMVTHDIVFPDTQRLVKGQSTNSAALPLRVYSCPRNALNFYDLKYFAAHEHPLIDKILERYVERKRDWPLWTYVQGQATADEVCAVVVRRASENKTRAALVQALKSVGYDPFGRSLDEKKRPLRGTIRVAVVKPKEIIKADFGQLVEYLSKLLPRAFPEIGTGGIPQAQTRTMPRSGGFQQGRNDTPQPQIPKKLPEQLIDERMRSSIASSSRKM